jgi:hypothetical protein
MIQKFKSFEDFWPFYLSQHNTPICRAFHYAGTLIATVPFFYFIFTGNFLFIPLSLLPGYGLAWIGHFGFEKNKPAAFNNPIWSLLGDYKMLYYFFAGKIVVETQKPEVQTYLK